MEIGEIIDTLNDIYEENGELTAIIEVAPDDYRKINFIDIISNGRAKFVVLS